MKKKQLFFLLLCLVFKASVCFDLDTALADVQQSMYDTKDRVLYYKTYLFAGLIGSSGFLINKKVGMSTLCAMPVYGLYEWFSGYKEIQKIKKHYQVRTTVEDYWKEANAKKDELFLFCRWRQQDDRFGDGYYWPTAWLMNEEKYLVRTAFIKDIYAQRIRVQINGKKIDNPSPIQVMVALNKEIEQLQEDKQLLKKYTDVYRNVEQPEAFHPDNSGVRIFWPNYNLASQIYIELVVMLKRLETLRDIISSIRTEVGGNGWPRL
ncbi:MAG: hypothetical protein WDZ41_05205 [Candidatus Babeliales bacterium]